MSHVEQRTTARVGGVLFRNRSWLPVPLLVVALLARGRPTASHWLAGIVLVLFGECIRLVGVAAAGAVTRRRSRDVQRLVTYGIFNRVRNPLYVGNFFIWMGVVVVSGVGWLLPVAIALFAVEYTLIVAYEEAVLESIFGQEYLEYKATTPRWIPWWSATRVPGPHDWSAAWRSERSTLLQYAAIIIVFVIKQRIRAG